MRSLGLRLEQSLRQATMTGTAPAVSLAVSQGEHPPHYFHFGHTCPQKTVPVTHDTIFDLASLTKPLTTTLWALNLVQSGHLDLERAIGQYIPIHDRHIRERPVWSLMTHTAGWRPFREYFRGLGRSQMTDNARANAKKTIRRMIGRDTCSESNHISEIYSDIGYLCLEWICESVDKKLAESWKRLPFHGPNGIHFTTHRNQGHPKYAATEQCPWRGSMIQGVVHDDNAWIMGGDCGHAGAFGSLESVHQLATHWMKAANGHENSLGIDAELIRHALDRSRMDPNGTRIMGWDTPTPGRSTSGQFFGRRSFGHLGFTGTSVWIDPESEIVITLLTNRVSPSRNNIKIRELRPIVHDLAYQWILSRNEEYLGSESPKKEPSYE